MNPQELIASGLLEAYVLGEGTSAERAQVERSAAMDSTVKAELEHIELALEKHARSTAVAPPVGVRAGVLAAVKEAGTPVIPITRQVNRGPWRWVAAAAMVALLVSAAVNFTMYSELHTVKQRLVVLETEGAVMAEQLQVQQTSLSTAEKQLAVVFDPSMRIVPLAAQAIDPTAAARVFMDPTTNEVYLDVLSLPAPPAGKQYQLWAQVNGELLDAGLLALAEKGERLQQMKAMPNATAFGITLEKEGGNATPTLTALYLFGPVG